MKMKNKREEDKIGRQQHLERLKEEKRRKRKESNIIERNEIPSLEIKPTFLIVCEGEVTEPSYFEQFRLTSATVEIVGKGFNTLSLVNEAYRIQQSSKVDYSDVWCVFDKDDFSNQAFEEAISLAEHYGFRVAYSNQAFEYWLLLHLNDHQGGAINRVNYADMINNALKPFNLTYGDNGRKIITDEIFEIFLAKDARYQNQTRIDLAINRAKRLEVEYNKINASHSQRCSGTTVHLLVQEMLKYIE
ncbi:RloB family protein [Myroides sp. LJL115]